MSFSLSDSIRKAICELLHCEDFVPVPQVPPIVVTPPQPPAPAPLPTPVPAPQSSRSLYFVKHDGLPRHSSDPETVPTFYDRLIPMTPEMVNYWQGLLKLMNPGMSQNDFNHFWKSLTTSARAFDNGNGSETDHFKIQELICGGAVVEAVSDTPVKLRGKLWLAIHTLDPLHVPSLPVSRADIDMTKSFLPTIATDAVAPNGQKMPSWMYMADGKGTYKVDPFPQFNGNSIVPFFSKGGMNYLPLDRLVKIPDAQPFPSAFFPFR